MKLKPFPHFTDCQFVVASMVTPGNVQSINHRFLHHFSSITIKIDFIFYIYVCQKIIPKLSFLLWTALSCLFFLFISECCIYTHIVNSKFTTWQYLVLKLHLSNYFAVCLLLLLLFFVFCQYHLTSKYIAEICIISVKYDSLKHDMGGWMAPSYLLTTSGVNIRSTFT